MMTMKREDPYVLAWTRMRELEDTPPEVVRANRADYDLRLAALSEECEWASPTTPAGVALLLNDAATTIEEFSRPIADMLRRDAERIRESKFSDETLYQLTAWHALLDGLEAKHRSEPGKWPDAYALLARETVRRASHAVKSWLLARRPGTRARLAVVSAS